MDSTHQLPGIVALGNSMISATTAMRIRRPQELFFLDSWEVKEDSAEPCHENVAAAVPSHTVRLGDLIRLVRLECWGWSQWLSKIKRELIWVCQKMVYSYSWWVSLMVFMNYRYYYFWTNPNQNQNYSLVNDPLEVHGECSMQPGLSGATRE